MKGPSPGLAAGAGVVTVLAGGAALAPWISPYDARAFTGGSLEEPSALHWLGTNDLGQDILSQLIWGARSSLVVAVGAASLAVALGVLVGAGSALLGRTADLVTMRVVDLFLALPAFPLVIVIATVAGPTRAVLILIIGLAGWPVVARAVHGQALSLGQRGFVGAARGLGGSPLYVLRRHLLPGLGPLIASRFFAWIPVAIFLEAGLAFLGLGDPIGVSWGLMLNRALNYQGLYFTPLWTWWVLPAGIAITVTVLGFVMLGVGLEPWFNPSLARPARSVSRGRGGGAGS